VSLFSSIFFKLLNEDSVNEFTTWNSGTLSHNIGPNFKLDKPTERHRKIIKDPGFRKYAQTVPDMHRPDPKAIQSLEDLKKSTNGRKVLNQDEVQKISKQFGISRLNSLGPKRLGNTGIVLKFDPHARGYVIEK